MDQMVVVAGSPGALDDDAVAEELPT
jgi:hypothetical protein